MSTAKQNKRLFFDTTNRQIFFLDEKGELLPKEKRIHIKDHISWKNNGWMIIQDMPNQPENKQPKSVTNQIVKCSYCENNLDPKTETIKPLTSSLQTEKPEYVKTLQPPGFDEDGNPVYGIALYRIKLFCTEGHHFYKHYREWIIPRSYDFLSYNEEVENGLLDPLFTAEE